MTYPDNIKMAKKYGIWVGSSHCEPMLRNNVDEWHRWSPEEGERGSWNFDENPDQITEYWRQRVEETKNYDGIYTVGMRGIHDGSMPGGRTIDDKLDILDDVLDTQRDLLSSILGIKEEDIPQIFCPYKEVLTLYRSGAKIPDDVTIMWADDNHGYIRQLSNTEERKRSGGAGVYYHMSYWGRPHDYLWLESTPVALIWEEMHKAYETNAKRIWIGNVGDIKPNEISMSFFLEMAWDPEQFSPENLNAYYTRFAEAQFGAEYAAEIGEVIRNYFQLGFSRKPEHMGWNTVYPDTPIQDPELSLEESQERIAVYDALEKQAEEIYKILPAHLKDAFFQLVEYKVIGASSMNKKILYAYMSRVYAAQGRVVANEYAEKAQTAYERIQEITETYNTGIADGKWMQGLGRMNDAMGSFPVTAVPFNPKHLTDAPSLRYDFNSEDSGEVDLYFYCLPNQPINADCQLRFAVSVDGGKPEIVNAVLKKEMDEKNAEWQTNVLRAATIPSSRLRISGKGKHTLKVTMIDPGVVIDKIEIVTGGRKSSYFGAPEKDRG
jgi:hypothetical protein